jgi:hypothetical protein
MTDDDQQQPGETAAQGQSQGSPSARAARRARRIGGRPAGAGPAPADAASDARPAPAGQPTESTPGTVPTYAPTPVPTSVPAGRVPVDEYPPGPPDAYHEAAPFGQPATAPAWLNWLPAEVLSAGAVVMAVLIVVFSHGVWWGPDPSHTPGGGANLREQVLAAAKTCVAKTNTYKYTDLDSYESGALRCATGKFADDLKRTIDSVIKVNAPKLKSSQTAQINQGGIETIAADGQQWTILLYGQLSVTNTDSTQPRVDPFAAQVRMDHVNGKWLISALATVATPLS